VAYRNCTAIIPTSRFFGVFVEFASCIMTTSISVHLSRNYVSDGTKDVFIIATSAAQFGDLSADSEVFRSAGFDASAVDTIKGAAASRLKPGRDSGSAIELLVQSGSNFRRVILGALPTAFSRHNTPSRAHSVASLIRSNKGSSSNLTVLLLPSSESYAFAHACAASRAFSDYSLKTPGASASSVDIVLHLPGEPKAEDETLAQLASFAIDGIHLAQRLVDMPPNLLHTDAYVAEAIQATASIPGVSVEVIQGQQLDERGFGGLWVGASSIFCDHMLLSSGD
jgi:leucyl aminopeptidase